MSRGKDIFISQKRSDNKNFKFGTQVVHSKCNSWYKYCDPEVEGQGQGNESQDAQCIVTSELIVILYSNYRMMIMLSPQNST